MGQSQDKVYSSLCSGDQQRLRNKFDKISGIKGGSSGSLVSLQGFKSIFPTNRKFAKKLFMWATKSTETVINNMDYKQFVKCAEYFLIDFKENQSEIGQYSKVELFGIASFNNQISGNEFDREFVNRVEITYTEALQFIKELTFILFEPQDMTNPHTENDDIAAKVVANGIFKQKEKLEFYTFFEIFQQQFSEADKIVQDYFSKIFLNRPLYDYTIPEYHFEDPEDEQPSLILRKGISALLCMSHENFGKFGFMKPLFEHIVYDGEEFDFDTFSKELLQYEEGPTLILIRHYDQFEEVDVYAQAKSGTKERVGKNHHVLGILCNTKYRPYPQLSGDSTTTLFSMIPNFKVFSPARGEMERQYANLSTHEQSNGVPAGLLVGGDPKTKARVFIGKDIHFSYIDNYGSVDQTYERGNIFDCPKIDQLKIDIIEVWGLTNKGVKKEVIAAPVVHKHTVQEDYGIMKPQDDGYLAEFEEVHNRGSKIPQTPEITEDFYKDDIVHHHPPHHQQHYSHISQPQIYQESHILEHHSYVRKSQI